MIHCRAGPEWEICFGDRSDDGKIVSSEKLADLFDQYEIQMIFFQRFWWPPAMPLIHEYNFCSIPELGSILWAWRTAQLAFNGYMDINLASPFVVWNELLLCFLVKSGRERLYCSQKCDQQFRWITHFIHPVCVKLSFHWFYCQILFLLQSWMDWHLQFETWRSHLIISYELQFLLIFRFL